jgi:nucleoside transporter
MSAGSEQARCRQHSALLFSEKSMSFSLRLRLSIMMFLQYFIWGAWSVTLVTFLESPPSQGGLGFSGSQWAYIAATMPIGAMISPIFIGLFADRLFSTERVLVVLHLAGAALLGYAAFTCEQNLAGILDSFQTAAKDVKLKDVHTMDTTLLAILEDEKLTKEQIQKLKEGAEREELKMDLDRSQRNISGPALAKIYRLPEVADKVTQTSYWLFGIMLGYALCYMPTITLTNSLSFRNLSNPDRYFGSIRVLGTIGWIVAGWVLGGWVGSALGRFGITIPDIKVVSPQPLYLAAGASLALGLFCFALPHTPPSGGAKTLGETLGLPALAMLKDTSYAVFFVCSFLITILLAFYYSLVHKFLTDIGAPNPTVLLSFGQVSEILFMLLLPVGLAYLGTKKMLAIGMLAWAVRYGIFYTLDLPAIMYVGVPLHGICYDFFFVVSYLYVDRKAPSDLRASAQGMITFITLGVGMFLGNLLQGYVQEYFTSFLGRTEWKMVWIYPAAGAAIATFLFFMLFEEQRTKTQPKEEAAFHPPTGLEPVTP